MALSTHLEEAVSVDLIAAPHHGMQMPLLMRSYNISPQWRNSPPLALVDACSPASSCHSRHHQPHSAVVFTLMAYSIAADGVSAGKAVPGCGADLKGV